MHEKGFEVRQTVSLDDLKREALRDVKVGFDKSPLKEVRERCLESIYPWSDEDFQWLAERIRAYREISDYTTTILLLRRIALFKPRLFFLVGYEWGRSGKEDERHIVIRDLLIETLEALLSENFLRDHLSEIKEVLVMLCGRLKDIPKLYNDRIRKVFQGFFERYIDSKGRISIVSCFDLKLKEDYERLLQRILKVIIHVKDKGFLPVLYHVGEDPRSHKQLISFLQFEEQLALEALRMFTIQYLENC